MRQSRFMRTKLILRPVLATPAPQMLLNSDGLPERMRMTTGGYWLARKANR